MVNVASSVVPFLDRHLDQMGESVAALGDERVNARPPVAGANSAAALVAHCVGLANWWIGHQIDGREVDRDRDGEFRATASVAELLAMIEAAKARYRDDLAGVDLAEPIVDPSRFPAGHHARSWTKLDALVHAVDEIAQHHGHLDLTRDLLMGG